MPIVHVINNLLFAVAGVLSAIGSLRPDDGRDGRASGSIRMRQQGKPVYEA